MRTIHVGVRVVDAERSLAFYTALGYEIVGRVADTPMGDLTMLKLPDDDDFVTIELMHDPEQGPAGSGTLSHLVIAVESMEDAVAVLTARGVDVPSPTSRTAPPTS